MMLGTCVNCGRKNVPIAAKGRCTDCNYEVTIAVRSGKSVEEGLRKARLYYENTPYIAPGKGSRGRGPSKKVHTPKEEKPAAPIKESKTVNHPAAEEIHRKFKTNIPWNEVPVHCNVMVCIDMDTLERIALVAKARKNPFDIELMNFVKIGMAVEGVL